MLILIGTNHRSAPVALRERMAFAQRDLPEVLARLTALPEIEEGLVLSTCNRVEIVARSRGSARGAVQVLREFLCRERGVAAGELDRYSYQFAAGEVVGHLFRVASSLDSMILGEPQILGQVKEAYRVARECGATGPVLERLMQHGLGAAKRVRNETGIAKNAVSVAYAAVELATRIFGALRGRRVLLLGAGKMSDLVARHLIAREIESLTVASRTYSHAADAAARFGGTAVHWEDGLASLPEVDIVVSCTAAPEVVLKKSDVAVSLRGRRRGPLFLIDIAVPRDIDQAINELDNVYVYDIDALQEVVDANLGGRRAEAEKAERILSREVESFERWRQTQAVAPVIVALRESMGEIGRNELVRFRRKLGPLSETQERALEELLRGVVQKLLHRPIRYLRSSVERHEMKDVAELYRRIFALGQEGGSDAAASEDDDAAQRAAGPQRLLRGGKDD
ncbi:MAG: glutamyl-tRNA reductase [bacterium]|nr:glutamyl-tRNA reductase [bacterium]